METLYNLNDNNGINIDTIKLKNSEKPHIIKKVDHFHIYLDIFLGKGQFGKVYLALDEFTKNTSD